MDYLDPSDSSKELTSRGVRGVGSLAGGLALLILKSVAGAFGGVVGLVLGAVSLAVGASSLKSEAKADRTGGAIALGAGALLVLAGLSRWHIPLISGIAALSTGLVGLGALGLLGYGAWNIFKFVKGLRNRA
ncbi:MAG TPA: hypothetical protein PLB91_13400 [Spirochaetales bacterium]|nr:hypothetical protein [Spirochaetales bacterium]HRY53737.1 hypothetical protein [Spirochaetia bacterium]HRZ66007.1 hypothetical protein [Spirochaetia bacterium]